MGIKKRHPACADEQPSFRRVLPDELFGLLSSYALATAALLPALFRGRAVEMSFAPVDYSNPRRSFALTQYIQIARMSNRTWMYKTPVTSRGLA
jgi:hypothetical protein